ncbi:MAG: hypothetical protein ACFCBU_15835, partial [Cyanophyceae cyanobacterium]
LLEDVLNRLRRNIRNDHQMAEFLEITLEILKGKFPLEVGYAADYVENLLGSLRLDMGSFVRA